MSAETHQRGLIDNFLAIHVGRVIIVRAGVESYVDVLVEVRCLDSQITRPLNLWIGSAAVHIPLCLVWSVLSSPLLV